MNDYKDKIFAPGKHVILDFFDTEIIGDEILIESALRETAKTCNATILECKLHSFGEGLGITGVLLLAESHISIHTWPETNFIAIDIFMCGDCDPSKAIDPLKRIFKPRQTKITEIARGQQGS